MSNGALDKKPEEIAIIGIAGRFPGAKDVDQFWQNLVNGVESIRAFTTEELRASGVSEATVKDPAFVNAGSIMDDADAFDASFFGFSTREAEIMDPQQRVFLECAWEAMENAGYDPEKFEGLVGVFGGVGPNTYFQENLIRRPDLLRMVGYYSVLIGSEREYAVTRVSFKLNLKGPSISINTACSTSGVAIHYACQSLLAGECDMALAGGARIKVPLKAGYLYEEGSIPSPDGHCRAFDAEARGTVSGSGAAMIVLKRLSDAIHDGDTIHAVIKGSAVNNDGSLKVGFTAPSVQGQAAVIAEALAIADVHPDTIGYIEAHATGTPLGDSIEIAALTKAFRRWTNRKRYCPIGSVKTNIGHLDAGAGVAGVIKTVLCLKHKQIPPSLNFEKPNPQIDFENSPFCVNTKLFEWQAVDAPRRAGISSFGLGGTNAHIILEEAPYTEPSGPSRPQQLLLLSGKSNNALEKATRNLAEHLKQHPELNLADVAHTLQVGRRAFNHRRMIVCNSLADAVSGLETLDPTRALTCFQEPINSDVVFMFSGQGSQYVNMGVELYETESQFREHIDHCSQVLQPHLGVDLREILYPAEENIKEMAQKLNQTFITQPVLFTIEYALAKLWMSWGVRPSALVGHSTGEYVAACLAEVFPLEDALSLVATRGRLMQEVPGGSMLAVRLSEEEIQRFLNKKLSLSAVNSPSLCVVSGEKATIQDLEKELSRKNVDCRELHTSHAFHSKMVEPILDTFAEHLRQVGMHPPQIPFLSNFTGTWITPNEATAPSYWTRHLRQTVRFSDCVGELLKEPNKVLLEVGPGHTLSTLTRQHPNKTNGHVVLSSIRHPKEQTSDTAFILNTLGRLWLAGIQVNWSGFYAFEHRRRIPLPTYPFERKRYWINSNIEIGVTLPSVSSSYNSPEEATFPDCTSQEQEITGAYEGAPRNEVEQTVAKIWEELLGVERIRIHDNFFDLGGSSLMGARLFAQIDKIFEKKLALSTIYHAPTIEQLAAILDENREWTPNSSLVCLQGGGSKPPFFCLPGILGNVFTDLGYLAKHLGSDQPVYGLQEGLEHPPKVKALAAHHIDDIRSVQPEGPFFLGGICAGATVAFEMAQQLRSQSQMVGLLAMVEPVFPSFHGILPYLDLVTDLWDRFVRRSFHHSGTLARLTSAERKLYLRLRMKLVANIWALKRYIPRPYPGYIHLFLTDESLNLCNKRRRDWRELAIGGTETHDIPGTHNTITGNNDTPIEEAHMQVLAHKIRVCIDSALADEGR